MLDPTLGIINYGLQALGFAPVGFLGDPGLAMASIVLIDLWWQTAFVFIVLLGRPPGRCRIEPLEAAEVDGASSWQRLPVPDPAAAQAGRSSSSSCSGPSTASRSSRSSSGRPAAAR